MSSPSGRSAYPAGLDELVPQVQRLAGELGRWPSQNRVMAQCRVGVVKAREVLSVLKASGFDPATAPAAPPPPAPPAPAADLAPASPMPDRVPVSAPVDPGSAGSVAAGGARLRVVPGAAELAGVTGDDRSDATGAARVSPQAIPAGAPVPTGPPVAEGDPGPAGSSGRGAGSPAGVFWFYLVSVMSMLVSVDTSWRFFAQVLHITNVWERAAMFAVVEVALIACGYGMRANVRDTGSPGHPRLVAWVLCGLAGYMAWQLSGVAEGIARVAIGPVLGMVMLHLALGIELRTGGHQRVGTWARVGRELRERFLSRLGLSDDERDALARTRDRAARRVARLTLGRRIVARQARLARALRASNVAHDPGARARMLAELAAIRHATDLTHLSQPSPWHQAPAPARKDPTP